MAATSPPRFFAAWRVEAPFSAVSHSGGFYILCYIWLAMLPCMIHHPTPGKILLMNVNAHTTLCLAFFSALWLRCNQSILVQETHTAKDLDLTCFTTCLFKNVTCIPVGPTSLDWAIDPLARSDLSGSSLPLEVLSGEQQPGTLPACTRSRWRQGALHTQPQILQRTTGWDGCGPFFSGGLRCITLNTTGLVGSVFSRQRNREFKLKCLKRLLDNNNIICLQEVHGREEFFQAIQVLAPRFRLFGTFLPDNGNAGGSAICIQRDLLPGEAIVSHVIACQGRDHLVNIRSERHNLVIVNVHFEPELTLSQLRDTLRLFHPHWPAYPCGVRIFW